MRAEELADQELPVLVLDVNEREAEVLLATHDPLGAMATRDDGAWRSLLANMDAESKVFADWLAGDPLKEESPLSDGKTEDVLELPRSFQVLVECEDEAEQREVYEALTRDGRQCRLLSLGGM